MSREIARLNTLGECASHFSLGVNIERAGQIIQGEALYNAKLIVKTKFHGGQWAEFCLNLGVGQSTASLLINLYMLHSEHGDGSFNDLPLTYSKLKAFGYVSSDLHLSDRVDELKRRYATDKGLSRAQLNEKYNSSLAVLIKIAYVYLVSDGEYTKIGVTEDITKRLHNLQTGNARSLKVLHTEPFVGTSAYKVEAALHSVYRDFNVLNEWFDLTDEQCLKIINDF